MWREALRVHIQDVRQRQRIALALGVHPLTLVRWINRVSIPRLQYLRDLPNILLEQRDEVLQSILEEFPMLREPNYKETAYTHIGIPPTDFSRKVLRLLTVTSPALRYDVLCDAILADAINALDPHNLGIVLLVARCMPPSLGQKVRSLLVTTVRGSAHWQQYVEQMEQSTIFLGIESLAGHAVSTLSADIGKHLFNDLTHPSHHGCLGELIQSAIATPILHLGGIGGCVIALSSQPHSFSFLTQRDFKDVANLLALSFSPDAFYPPEQVDLALLPEYCVQKEYIASYDQRLSVLVTNNVESTHPLRYMQVAQKIWRDIEEEMLKLSPTFATDKRQAVSCDPSLCAGRQEGNKSLQHS